MPYQYDTARFVTPTVGDYATIRFDRNEYSVPIHFLRKVVTVKGYANRVQIIYDKDTVVEYERLFGERKASYRLEHYLNLLERKTRSVFQAKPIRESVSRVLIEVGKKLPGGNKEMVRLLRICVNCGQDEVFAAVIKSPFAVTPTVDLVCSYLGSVGIPTCYSFYQRDFVADLSYYDRKCGVAR